MSHKPNPIDCSDIPLPKDLEQLIEAIAQNVHDVWAANRIAEGWSYGTQRDDVLKQTPCLVSYDQLPDEERDYDRNTAIETIKLILNMGYEIKKK